MSAHKYYEKGESKLNDGEIVDLYLARDESALRETEAKYGKYLYSVAYNLLHDAEDSRECVNDSYLAAWDSIPPNRPTSLLGYMIKLTRRICVDRLRCRTRLKRRAAALSMSLSELDEYIFSDASTEGYVDSVLLAEAINVFLRTLPQLNRDVFIGRYFYCDPLREIARYCGISVSNAKTILHRVRKGLKQYLIQEGFINEKK